MWKHHVFVMTAFQWFIAANLMTIAGQKYRPNVTNHFFCYSFPLNKPNKPYNYPLFPYRKHQYFLATKLHGLLGGSNRAVNALVGASRFQSPKEVSGAVMAYDDGHMMMVQLHDC